MEFQEFPKIGRLSRDMVITEKIDGTNAQIFIGDEVVDPIFLAGSRSRWLSETEDNYGFCKWAMVHRDELLTLGPGRHFGEWWGQGIQRRYGLTEKRFSLFNVGRWVDTHGESPEVHGNQQFAPACCHVVPVLLRYEFNTEAIGTQLERLKTLGSVAAPGYMNPEGLVIFHSANGALFKKTIEKDEVPKSRQEAA